MEPGNLSPEEAALWRAADRILDELLELPADARQAALDAHDCPQPVRVRVQRLLREEGASADRLENARVLLTPAPPGGPSGLAGRTIGRWVLEGVIGTGGMSVVHAAHDANQPERRVAIKLLAGSAIGAIASERLQREQRALSRLNHPHIVPLIEAGFLDDGTPWLAMGLVEGTRIDAWCFERGLDVAARVRLMVDVAEAVAHAHRALIVHRDLKPGNVLVDADGEVRLLDFGIAGLIDPGAERTITLMHALTPEYAAPEQFEGAPPDTAMDVYGLGALLHRLLTGQPPGRRGAADTRTTTPSLSIVESAYADVALRERAKEALRGDLDAVLLKALEPEPAQRYASAREFAADLRAWLEARPVTAQRPTLRYRVGKFVRRHRGAVGVAVAAVLAVLAALGVALWQAERAAEAARLAEQRAAETARESARAGLVSEFLVDLFTAAGSAIPGSELPSVGDLLALAERRIGSSFESDPRTAARLLTEIGRVNLSLGRREEARVLLEDARSRLAGQRDADPDDQARVAVFLARVEARSARFDEAQARIGEAKRLLDGRTGGDPRIREALFDVEITVLNATGRNAEALERAGELHAWVHGDPSSSPRARAAASYVLGVAKSATGDHASAEAALLDAETVAAALSGEWDLKLGIENSLSITLSRLGRLNDALARQERLLAGLRDAYPPDHPRIGMTLINLADEYRRVGRTADALAAADEALPIVRRRLSERHPVVAAAHNARGLALAGRGDDEQALAAYASAQAILAGSSPESDPRRLMLALNEAISLVDLGRGREAMTRVARIEAATTAPPSIRAAAQWVAARAAIMAGDAASARSQAQAAADGAAAAAPSGSGLRARALVTLAESLQRLGDGDAARAALADAATELERIGADIDADAVDAIREQHRVWRLLGATDEAARILRTDRARIASQLGAEDARVKSLDAFAREQGVAID